MINLALFLVVLAAISLVLWIMQIAALPAGYTLLNAAMALAALGFVLLLARVFIGRGRSAGTPETKGQDSDQG